MWNLDLSPLLELSLHASIVSIWFVDLSSNHLLTYCHLPNKRNSNNMYCHRMGLTGRVISSTRRGVRQVYVGPEDYGHVQPHCHNHNAISESDIEWCPTLPYLKTEYLDKVLFLPNTTTQYCYPDVTEPMPDDMLMLQVAHLAFFLLLLTYCKDSWGPIICYHQKKLCNLTVALKRWPRCKEVPI